MSGGTLEDNSRVAMFHLNPMRHITVDDLTVLLPLNTYMTCIDITNNFDVVYASRVYEYHRNNVSDMRVSEITVAIPEEYVDAFNIVIDRHDNHIKDCLANDDRDDDYPCMIPSLYCYDYIEAVLVRVY